MLLLTSLSSCHFDFILDTVGVIVPGGALLFGRHSGGPLAHTAFVCVNHAN